MPPCNCHHPFPRPEPFSPLPRPGQVPDWGKWIRDRIAEKGALLAFPSVDAFPDPGAGPNLYLAEDTDIVYRWDGAHYQVVFDPENANDVLEYENRQAFPATGRHGKLYIAADTGSLYRWDDTDYAELLPSKADKVAPAAEGNLAALTQDGNLADSGKKPADFATAAQGARADTAVQPGDITGFVDGAAYDAEYGNPPKPTILLKHGNEVVATVDAAAFVIDGMVSNVQIVGGNLVITFNTDSGKQPISIPLTDIFNPANYYTKTETNTLLAEKATKADATLTPIYSQTPTFSEWTILRDGVDVTSQVQQPTYVNIVEGVYGWTCPVIAGDQPISGYKGINESDAISLTWSTTLAEREPPPTFTYTVTRTRTDIIGYTLGSQTDKPLASEAEAEALRTGKQNALTTQQLANIAAVPSKANKSDVDPLLFAQYYPEGNVKSAAEFTANIKYDAPDTTNRTIMVKPFCNTGTAANDNSGLVGRVVIPPFVDAQGNPYISDDGTRFKVVGVSDDIPNDINRNLTAVVAPTTVTSISDSAFENCRSLTSVSFPDVTIIEYHAFNYCTSLASVDFGDTPRSSVPSLGNDAFSGIPSTCKIIVPYTQYDEWKAASGWSSLPQDFVRHAEKADKPATFTTGNLAKFDENGNPVDSNKKPSDFQNALSAQQLAKIAAVSDALAFDATHSYAAGDPVVYNGTLYTFTAAHTGAWTGSDVEAVDIIAMLAGKLNKSGGTITGDLEVVYTSDGFKVKNASGDYLQIQHATVAGNFWYVNYSVANVGSGGIRLPYGTIIPADIHSLAEPFNTSTTYAPNSLCIDYEHGVLYRCINPNGHTGAWVAADFTVATVEDVLAALRTAIAGKANASDLLAKLDSTSAAPAFSTSSTYAVGDHVTYNGGLYRCTTAVTTAGAWDASKWTADTVAMKASNPTAGNLAALDANGNPTDSGVKASDKLDASSASAPFSSDSSTQYAVGEHVTYNGKLYKCTTATTGGTWDASKWTADTMTDPDAVLDITAQNQLRVVAKDGTVLWAQGYDLASTSSATLACDATNNFTFADGATTQAFTLPIAPTGKVGDFGLDIDNSANTGAATMTLTGLDTTFSVVVPEGESLNDMLAIAAGELARFYITLSTFRINNLPTWHIVKQVVENGGATV